MSFVDRLERKFGKYAIPHLYRYLIICSAIGLALEYTPFGGYVLDFLQFDPTNILFRAQVWRLVTWVFVPSGSVIGTILFGLCAWMWGRSLEQLLGTFRLNVFLIGGVIISVIGSFVLYGITAPISLVLFHQFSPISVFLSSYYLLLSMLMAMALIMPDAEVRLWFVLPVKMKWMLVLEGGFLLYDLIRYFVIGYKLTGVAFGVASGFVGGLIVMLSYGSEIIFAVLNMILFFAVGLKRTVSRKQKKRKAEFERQMRMAEPRPGSGITRHKCIICGRTEKDDPNLNFRYCSKCTGNKEYCSEHLFTHEHK